MARDLTERMEQAMTGSDLVKNLADGTQKIVNPILTTPTMRPVKTFLNGTWLEHPLHPVITDVPVGAWTVTMLLDVLSLGFGVKQLGRASGIAAGLGVVGALGAALTGLADWTDVDPPEQKVGIVHAITNIVGTIFFALSWWTRRRDRWKTRPASFVTALAGYSAITVGAYIGGSLVYRQGTMINRNAHRSGPDDYVPVLGVDQLAENTPKRVMAKGKPIMLVRRGDSIYALGAVCSHYGGPLEEGKLVGDCIECPWHSSQFALADGSVQQGPATAPEPVYDVRVNNGQVEVRERHI